MESLSPCIFGVCFIKDEKIEDFELLWKMFFKEMRYVPESIITDQQASVIAALARVKEDQNLNYFHLLDQFHLLKSIRKKIPNKDDLDYFRNVMYSKSYPVV